VTAVDWQLQTEKAAFEGEDWQASMDPRAPQVGMQINRLQQDLTHLFRVMPKTPHSCSIQEAYVREDDLIVRYEQSGDDLFTFQLNWRVLPSDVAGSLALELWISVQTTLLDTHPKIDVRSRAAGAMWHDFTLNDLSIEKSDTTAVGLFKKAGVTSIVMVQPSDAHQSKRVRDKNEDFTLRMFGEFMEKGVIRRARLRFYSVPGELSRFAIINQYRAFIDSPLPLTA
jgi:hypothetical protein